MTLVADTGGLYALFDADDKHHAAVRKIVEREPGLFEPREVALGAAGGGYQEIRQGLEAGEMVVASSQFLIDSESNLREAIGKMLAR